MRSVEQEETVFGQLCTTPNRQPTPRKAAVKRAVVIWAWAALTCCAGWGPGRAEGSAEIGSACDFVLTGAQTFSSRRTGLMSSGSPDELPDTRMRSVIDVMVLYTGAAKEAYGEAAVRAKIALSIAHLNEACNRSGVNARFRLVHQAEVTWHEERPLAIDELYWLSGDSTVAELRDRVGADLVSLLVRDASPTGGIAELPGVFSVYNGNPFLFSHECGHNLGCAHDRANAGYSYDRRGFNYGYAFTPPGTAVCYGDIMSYRGSQFQQFSNPDKYFRGAPTGLPEGHTDACGEPDAADNVLALNRASPYSAAARPTQVTLLDSPQLSPDGAEFTFRISGPATGGCTIEHSTDHRNWVVFKKCLLAGDGAELSDGVGGLDHRFYRASLNATLLPSQVGFVKKTVPVGFSMISSPFDGVDNTVGSLFASPPEGVQLYKWIEGQQRWTCNTFSLGEWEDPAMSLHPGEGLVVHNPDGVAFTVGFAGEITRAVHNRIPTQLSIRSSTIPQAGLLSKVLGYVPFGQGGQVFRMTGGRYSAYTWDGGEWSPEEPVIELGEAIWCRNPVNPFVWQRVLEEIP